MFGIVRPCRHRLSEDMQTQWLAHLCGLCLALRKDHGQFARIATNYDGLVISVLTEAQTDHPTPDRRTAGPCPLRGMRTATVATGEGAHLAAGVSLILASAKVRDHIADKDGVMARKPIAAAAKRIATTWDRAGTGTTTTLGFDPTILLDAVDRQTTLEHTAGPTTALLTLTEPTETATAAAFAHTAHLADKPHNATPLAEAGKLFGRLAHLLDAVEDQQSDAAANAFNPLTVTGTTRHEARRLCNDAVRGIRLALKDVDLQDSQLAHQLLAHEVRESVHRVFGDSHNHNSDLQFNPQVPNLPWDQPPPPQRPRRGLIQGCAVWSGLFCTCQICCADPYHSPWTGEPKQGWCVGCDCCSGCADCCDCDGCCCDCGDCCSCDC
ncbi:hypothetical protein JGU71_13255 [Antrihabitans sp. YC3-6]|uniref:Regulatory protein n=1 Tax=Antrihabitans stalagmiti TaxID=2799499 RepID=A0A934U3X1_9NOCA|nr:DUF5685 family protein [Antrihabitans stalagmiti]MBJ8339857.1 hypothetical protein [Antrihabitans stalagmiti]